HARAGRLPGSSLFLGAGLLAPLWVVVVVLLVLVVVVVLVVATTPCGRTPQGAILVLFLVATSPPATTPRYLLVFFVLVAAASAAWPVVLVLDVPAALDSHRPAGRLVLVDVFHFVDLFDLLDHLRFLDLFHLSARRRQPGDGDRVLASGTAALLAGQLVLDV